MAKKKKIDVEESAQKRNLEAADRNRELFRSAGITVLNLIGSPGCGKTSILEYTARECEGRFAVVVGDVKTALDAERIEDSGIIAAPIETGGTCHLTAEMVRNAVESLDLDAIDYLFIENVGNLVCPSTFDLGEDQKVAVVSLPEGDDKVRKYPSLFSRAGMTFINKMDLLDAFPDYDVERIKEDLQGLKSDMRIFETSAETGEGMDDWFAYLQDLD